MKNAIPTEYAAFKAWRKKQKFEGQLASLAAVRERDLEVLELLKAEDLDLITGLRADIEAMRQQFEAALAERT